MRGSATAPRFLVPGGRCGASARRRADAKLVSALDASVRTSDRALREVERLKRQRLVLARHVAILRDRTELAARIIAALERDGNTGVEAMMELRRTIQRRDEEIGHLRFESAELMGTVLRYKDAMEKDASSVLEESWELAKRLRTANHEIERLKRQRSVLVRHMRTAQAAVKEWRACMYELGEALDSPILGLRATAVLARRTVKWVWKQIQRIPLIALVGWRGSYEVQEQLDA